MRFEVLLRIVLLDLIAPAASGCLGSDSGGPVAEADLDGDADVDLGIS